MLSENDYLIALINKIWCNKLKDTEPYKMKLQNINNKQTPNSNNKIFR